MQGEYDTKKSLTSVSQKHLEESFKNKLGKLSCKISCMTPWLKSQRKQNPNHEGEGSNPCLTQEATKATNVDEILQVTPGLVRMIQHNLHRGNFNNCTFPLIATLSIAQYGIFIRYST